MSGDAKMQNAPPLMRQHQQHVEDLEPDGRYRKEVDRNHGLHVVLQEGSPDLGGRVVAAHQVLAHTRLANVDAQLEQLSVNPRSAPEWILAAHLPNPCAHLFRHGRPPRLTVSDLPGPEQTKAFPVPADQSPGSDDKHAGLPIAPDGKRQFTSFYRPLENAELMAESQDLELQQRP